MLSTKQTIINFQVVSQLKRERVSKPSSVLAAIYLRPTVTSRLKRPTRRVKPRAELTGIFGLAGGGVCPAGAVTDTAVRSCRTISPLPVSAGGGSSAVYFLWHYPAGRPGWLLTTTVPFPARTFLPAPILTINSRITSETPIARSTLCFHRRSHVKIGAGRPPDPLFSIDY